MKIGNHLYFAPKILFKEVDLDGCQLPNQFMHRVAGFYLKPANDCIKRGQAFAAGVLLVTAIDALARIRYGAKVRVANRFKRFAGEELQSFADGELAKKFYDQFRNGLVHEARLLNGAQFSLETQSAVEQHSGLVLVNPLLLLKEVSEALDAYIALLNNDATELKKLALLLRDDHRDDFRVAFG
jgi:hypothetical protein